MKSLLYHFKMYSEQENFRENAHSISNIINENRKEFYYMKLKVSVFLTSHRNKLNVMQSIK